MRRYLILFLLFVGQDIYGQKDTVEMEGIKGYGELINGLKNGHWTFWHPNKTIQSEGEYVNDMVTGQWKNYYENGNLQLIAEYEMGEPVGNWIAYFDDGTEMPKHYYGLLAHETKTAGDFISAIGYLNKGISLDMENHILIAMRADCYRELDKIDLAIRDFEFVLTKDKTPTAYKYASQLYYQKGDYLKALSTIDNALKADTKFGDAYTVRGLIHLKLSKSKKACDDFTKAKEYGTADNQIDEYLKACR